MNELKIGDKAPKFEAIDEQGNVVKLEDFVGKKLILFFYPKASTPGCTAEACSLRDFNAELLQKGFAILGVSADDAKRQSKFKETFNFPFPLLADTEKELIKLYGAWGKKKLYGKEYDGIFRYTFIISEKGVIEHIFHKVNTKSHAEEILNLYK